MRIGIDIKAFKNGSTGISRYLHNMMDWLQKLDSHNDYFLFECVPVEYKIFNSHWKKVYGNWKIPGILWQQFILPFYLKKYHIDLLWAPEQICPVVFKTGSGIITTVHDLTALRFPETCQKTNLLIQRYLFPLSIKRSDYLLPVSEFVGRELKHFYPQLVKKEQINIVTCGGPDWEIPQKTDEKKRKEYILFTGNMEPRKNLEKLIEALEILKQSGFKVVLHIAGPQGWKNQSLLRKIHSSPVRNQVKFLGYISEDELKNQIGNCKALVYPSLYEGFGLPVLEAFAMGTDVLTSRGTVMEEIARNEGIYFDSGNAADIAEKISSVFSKKNSNTCKEKQKIVKHYKWDDSAKKMIDLFRLYARSNGLRQ